MEWLEHKVAFISSPICTIRLIFSKWTLFIWKKKKKNQERSNKGKFRLLGDAIRNKTL